MSGMQTGLFGTQERASVGACIGIDCIAHEYRVTVSAEFGGIPSPLRIYFWWFETFRSSMGRSIFGARRDSLGFAHFPVEGQRLRGTCSIHARKPLDLADALEFTSAAIEAGEGGQELIDRREGPHA